MMQANPSAFIDNKSNINPNSMHHFFPFLEPTPETATVDSNPLLDHSSLYKLVASELYPTNPALLANNPLNLNLGMNVNMSHLLENYVSYHDNSGDSSDNYSPPSSPETTPPISPNADSFASFNPTIPNGPEGPSFHHDPAVMVNHSLPVFTNAVPNAGTMKPKRTYTKRRSSRKTPEPAPSSPETPTSPSASSSASSAEGAVLPPTAIMHLLEEADLKKKRLARKAELARLSRKRKKTRLSDLEDEVQRLTQELERVKKHRKFDQEMLVKQAQQLSEANWAANSNSTPSEESSGDLQRVIQAIIAASASQSNPESEAIMAKLMSDLSEVIKRRDFAAKLHISELEQAITPCMPLRFLHWAMTQNEKFYQDQTGLWHSLFVQDLKASPEQMKELINFRQQVRSQQAVFTEVEQAYGRLSSLMRQHMSNSSTNLTKLRSILTPAQLAKYFSWVERFGHICVKINL